MFFVLCVAKMAIVRDAYHANPRHGANEHIHAEGKLSCAQWPAWVSRRQGCGKSHPTQSYDNCRALARGSCLVGLLRVSAVAQSRTRGLPWGGRPGLHSPLRVVLFRGWSWVGKPGFVYSSVCGQVGQLRRASLNCMFNPIFTQTPKPIYRYNSRLIRIFSLLGGSAPTPTTSQGYDHVARQDFV